ncbi:hypothetical protein J2S18_000554 [Eubacterium multiforme]|uniref:Uncharacterized protein n=1 Tax=Eubacterium multiforme TaxID=83339 RepID=A0ABT9UQR6_9FIRM|nr:hypothetical protein [Eubacterium multiforme]
MLKMYMKKNTKFVAKNIGSIDNLKSMLPI